MRYMSCKHCNKVVKCLCYPCKVSLRSLSPGGSPGEPLVFTNDLGVRHLKQINMKIIIYSVAI